MINIKPSEFEIWHYMIVYKYVHKLLLWTPQLLARWTVLSRVVLFCHALYYFVTHSCMSHYFLHVHSVTCTPPSLTTFFSPHVLKPHSIHAGKPFLHVYVTYFLPFCSLTRLLVAQGWSYCTEHRFRRSRNAAGDLDLAKGADGCNVVIVFVLPVGDDDDRFHKSCAVDDVGCVVFAAILAPSRFNKILLSVWSPFNGLPVLFVELGRGMHVDKLVVIIYTIIWNTNTQNDLK